MRSSPSLEVMRVNSGRRACRGVNAAAASAASISRQTSASCFDSRRVSKRGDRRRLVVVAQRPGGRPAHQRLLVVQSANERRNRRRRRPIAEHDRRIAQDPAPLRPPQRRVAKPLAKRRLVQFKQLNQIDRIVLRAAARTSLAGLAPRANSKDTLPGTRRTQTPNRPRRSAIRPASPRAVRSSDS